MLSEVGKPVQTTGACGKEPGQCQCAKKRAEQNTQSSGSTTSAQSLQPRQYQKTFGESMLERLENIKNAIGGFFKSS